MNRYTYILSICFCLYACDRSTCPTIPEAETAINELKIVDMDREISKLQDTTDVLEFLKRYPLFANQFLQVYGYAEKGVLYNQVLRLNEDPYIDTLKQGTYEVFKSLEPISKDLSRLFGYIQYYYPSFNIPMVATVVTGFGTDLFYTDSLLVISLDYFTGSQGRFKPDIPDYIWQRYHPASLASIAGLLISNQFNQVNELDQSLVAEMVYYGKAYYLVQHLLPCAPDSIVMGYTQEELTILEKTKTDIWAYLVEQEHLFSTEHRIVNKYVGERPYIAEIGPSCPGRVGRWFGLQIVKAYMDKNKAVSIQELMADPDAKKIFMASKYKP